MKKTQLIWVCDTYEVADERNSTRTVRPDFPGQRSAFSRTDEYRGIPVRLLNHAEADAIDTDAMPPGVYITSNNWVYEELKYPL